MELALHEQRAVLAVRGSTLDTTQLADGFTICACIVYRDSNYDEYYVTRLRVDNARQAAAIHPTAARTAARRRASTSRSTISASPAWSILWARPPYRSCCAGDLLVAGRRGGWKFLFSDASRSSTQLSRPPGPGVAAGGAYDFRLRLSDKTIPIRTTMFQNVVAIPPTPTPVPGSAVSLKCSAGERAVAPRRLWTVRMLEGYRDGKAAYAGFLNQVTSEKLFWQVRRADV